MILCSFIFHAQVEPDTAPILALPSISEDDENQPDSEPIISLSPHLSSITRSPLHSTGSPARNLKLLNRGKSLVALRERVERQRSLNAPSGGDIQSNSLDGLNLERGSDFQMPRRQSIERLDNQVSSLHEDVAALSGEVRNAIQALQEMTYSTLASRADLGGGGGGVSVRTPLQPTRSIPNITQTDMLAIGSGTTTAQPLCSATCGPVQVNNSMPRSSSQPTETWCRTDEEVNNGAAATSSLPPTDGQLRAYILDNRDEVLRMLGFDVQPSTSSSAQQMGNILISIPELSLLPAQLNGVPSSNEFIYGGTSSVWMNNTDASSDPINNPQQPHHPLTNTSHIVDHHADGRPQLTIVNEATAAAQTPPTAMLRSRSERSTRSIGNSLLRMPRTSASDAEVNVVRRSPQGEQPPPVARRSSWRDSNISYRTMQYDDDGDDNQTYHSSSGNAVVVGGNNGGGSFGNVLHHQQPQQNPLHTTTLNNHHGYNIQQHHHRHTVVVDTDAVTGTTIDGLGSDGDSGGGGSVGGDGEADHSEKTSLIGNEVRHIGSGEGTAAASSSSSRYHLAPRARVNYRFSAGDADKLERGIRTIPSTRSLKDN